MPDRACSWRLCANNVIGGTVTGAGNVISGNAGDGIEISVAGTTGTIVRGNTIGLGLDGSTLLGNDSNGIIIAGADGTLIGGDDAADGTTDGVVNAGTSSPEIPSTESASSATSPLMPSTM